MSKHCTRNDSGGALSRCDSGAPYRTKHNTISVLNYRDTIVEHTIMSKHCTRNDSGAHYRDAIVASLSGCDSDIGH